MRGFVLLVALSMTCAEPPTKSTNNAPTDAGVGVDASFMDATQVRDAPPQSSPDAGFGDGGGTVDVAPLPDYCDSMSSEGFFPDCTACDANGGDCDTIESPNASGRACGCSGGCPCGLRCGEYEIGPNIFVNNICVR